MYKINVSQNAAAGLFDSRDRLGKLVEDVLNQILDAQTTEVYIGSDRNGCLRGLHTQSDNHHQRALRCELLQEPREQLVTNLEPRFRTLPAKYRKRLRTTNMMERFKREIRAKPTDV